MENTKMFLEGEELPEENTINDEGAEKEKQEDENEEEEEETPGEDASSQE